MQPSLRLAATAALFALAAPSAAAQALPQGTIFYTDGAGATPVSLGSVGFGGQDTLDVVQPDSVRPNGIALDPGDCSLYFASAPGNAALERVSLDGTGRQVILPGINGQFVPSGVDIDLAAGRLYWIAPGVGNRIGSCDTDGSNFTVLVRSNDATPPVSPRSIHFDGVGGKLYWWDAQILGFRRCNLDGTEIENVLFTDNAVSYDVDLVDGWFYWARNDELCRAKIDGSVPPAILLTDSDFFDSNMLSVVPELDLVAWVAAGTEVRWTSLSSPGVVHSTGTVPGTAGWQSLEVLPGPRVGFSVGPPAVQGGDAVTMTVCGGRPGATFFVRFGGAGSAWPANLPYRVIAKGVLDANGNASLGWNVPAWYSGVQLQFRARTLDPLGAPVTTRVARIRVL